MEGSRRPGGLNEMFHLRPETIAGILVELVTVGTSKQDPVTEQKACHQGGQTPEAADCHLPRDDIGKSRSGVGSRQASIRYGQDGNQTGPKRKSMHLAIRSTKHQPPKYGRGGVVGMLLHICRQFEDGSIVGVLAERSPGGGGPGHGSRRRRPEAAADRDPVVHHQGHRLAVPHRSAGRLEDAIEVSRRVFGSDMTDAPEIARGGIHHAAQLESKSEHVETRTEIGR